MPIASQGTTNVDGDRLDFRHDSYTCTHIPGTNPPKAAPTYGDTSATQQLAARQSTETSEDEDENSLFLPKGKLKVLSRETTAATVRQPISPEDTASLPIDVSLLRGKKRVRPESELEQEASKKPKPSALHAGGKQRNSIRACTRELSRLESYLLPKATKVAKDPAQLDLTFQEIRDFIHTVEYVDELSQEGIRASQILLDEGLPLVMENRLQGVDLPYDIMLDATALFKRWSTNDIEADVYRGMRPDQEEQGHHKWVTDPTYQHTISCQYRGQGGLVNGQWYATSLAAKIQGAHGAPGVGIHGGSIHGTYSIVLSASYENIDSGGRITYCGTKAVSKENRTVKEARTNATDNTKAMLVSYLKDHKIRVLRGAGMPQSAQYRPEKGLRYDGLYKIEGVRCVDKKTSDFRFDMRRVPGQSPIRYQGPEARPSAEEVRQLSIIKANERGSS